jgi:hypothetical protein
MCAYPAYAHTSPTGTTARLSWHSVLYETVESPRRRVSVAVKPAYNKGRMFMNLLKIGICTSLVLLCGVAHAAEPCGSDKAWAKECSALTDQVRTMCEPEKFITRSPEGAAKWLEAVNGGAVAFEKQIKAFAEKHPHCLTEQTAKNCRFDQRIVDQCTDLPAKFTKAWPDKIASERKEVERHLPNIEKKAQEDPKGSWSYYNDVKRYLPKAFGSVLWIEPDNAEFLAYQDRLKKAGKLIVAANLDRLEKVTCPKAGKPDPKLEKDLMKAYGVFLGKLSIKTKAHKLGMDRTVVKETDIFATQWEYANTTTCIEELADPSDPARCSVQSVSFKRSKPLGKKWSEWSFRAHGARDDAMLCKNLKK